MLVERLRKEWRAQEATFPLTGTLGFRPEGLVMGAGTMLAPLNSANDNDHSLRQDEVTRLLTLLSVAYGREMPPSTVERVDRALQCSKRGEGCLALIHLALAGLHSVENRRETARRLFMADGLMKAGVPPRIILQALDLPPATEPLQRFMDTEFRVPAGNGDISGEWAKTGSVLARLSGPAVKFLQTAAKIGARVANPYTLAFGLLLIPRGKNLLTTGDVPEIPGLHFVWDRGETNLQLIYEGQHGQRRINAMLGTDGLFHDKDKIVARLLDDGTVAVDPAEVSSDLADKDGPNLCPKTQPDKAGRGDIRGEKDKDYEDQIKLLVNPDNPTPRGYGYVFYNPVTGDPVYIDDCHHETGTPVEIKSEYEKMFPKPWGQDILKDDWLDQSRRQLDATKGRELLWVFALQDRADFASKIFKEAEEGREKIIVTSVPRVGPTQ